MNQNQTGPSSRAGPKGSTQEQGQVARPIDRLDLAAAIVIGLIFAIVKALALSMPKWGAGPASSTLPCVLCVGYIIYRGRKDPEKLDEWGITTPMTRGAVAAILVMMLLAAGALGAVGHALSGTLSFAPSYVFRAISYVVAAFPQQFFLCSVGLVSLAKLPFFRGLWRLPLVLGLLFGLAHFWSPVRISGSAFPVQSLITMPMGFLCAHYFLRYRTILPLTAAHAVVFVLFMSWVERHL
ncbi:MAG: hypothetical protein JNN17_17095 [Verrucomicrobiaceae bacterium]|nr:hypothetical protein [Verrucomicrobiaceae bacterium]